MGDLMRYYWIPALKSSELVRDGDPVRLKLLGEKLIAFRDTQNRVGVMDHRRPHRCASLFMESATEQGGIRCIYHGWKYDVTGQCIDMPSVAPHQDFKQKVRARAFPVRERAGIVWALIWDARESRRHCPDSRRSISPTTEINVAFVQRNCSLSASLSRARSTHPTSAFSHAGHVQHRRRAR